MNHSTTHIPDNALVRLDRTFRETGRLIDEENYELAKEKLHSINVNLDRISDGISSGINDLLRQKVLDLMHVCEQGANQDEPPDELGNGERPVRNQVPSRFRSHRSKTGYRGRPKVEITRNQLETLQRSGYTARRMASHFGCSQSLVYKKMKDEGLHMRDRYANISDNDLKDVIRDLHHQFPNCGCEMMTGLLKSRGLTVQRRKVRHFLAEVDPRAAAARWGNAVSRRTYKVAAPNSLWHMDAHMKLIRWGFVTNACVDGFSRLVTFIKCSTKNNATNVLQLFLEAVQSYSMPSRVRSDHGVENFLVAYFMNLFFGTERQSHITGESVHNVRIERLWRDVYKDAVAKFYTTFYELEDEGALDPTDELHRYSLHAVYLDAINEQLSTFQQAWNSHRIRTERNRTPEQIWRDGMLESSLDISAVGRVFGTEQSWESVVEDTIERYNLSRGTNDQEILVDELQTVNTRLSERQKEELHSILLNENVTLKQRYISHSTKVTEYFQS